MSKKQSELAAKAATLFPGLFGSDPHGDIDPAESPGDDSVVRLPSGRIRVVDDDFDIVKLMAEAKDPDTGLLRDLKINDKDLPSASSYYDYAFSIIGKDDHPPWMVQMWTGLMLFGEVCPVCSDRRWLNLEWFIEHVPRDRPSIDIKEGIQPLVHGKCPKCKRFKWDLIKNHGLRNYLELVNVLGQRSGKSSSAGHMASYHTHRMLKFPRLADLTNQMRRSTELTSTFVSLTYAKAVGVLWTPYIKLIDNSSWFKQYHELLDYYGEKYGVELYRKKDEYLKWYHKSMRSYPSGPKSQTLRGDTRILAIIDELGLFPLPTGNDEEDENSDRANSDEAHKSLTNSLVTVQSVQTELLKQGLNCPPGLMLGVSSPTSMRDKVMRLLEDSRGTEGREVILGVNLPTWKVNPSIDRDSPFIKLKYATNAEKAERDFGANPPRVHKTFIKATQVPQKLFCVKNSHTVRYQYDTPGLLGAKLERHYTPRFPSIVLIDAGHTNNSFSVVGAHFDFNRQKTVVTTVAEVMTHDNRKIDFNPIYENVILTLLKDLNGVGLIADQWQSLDLLSRARHDMGKVVVNGKEKDRCLCKQYSPKRKDFDALVAMAENNSIEFPFLSEQDYSEVCSKYIDYRTLNGQPVKHLLLQMLTVADQGETKTPTKGAGFTDDIFRALTLVSLIHTDAVMERLKEAKDSWVKERVGMPRPIYVSRGGGYF